MLKHDEVFLNYCKPRDIVNRLFMTKRHWFHGLPKIKITGNNKSFGVLIFDFTDELVEFKIWIKDRQKIINAAYLAVKDFRKYVREIYDEVDD